MADLFVSYARADKERVAPLIGALQAEGWSVWWDPEIGPGQEFDRLIAEELGKARAVVVVWTPTSVASRWVRGEAREAADRAVLAPVRFDRAELPIDLRAIHATDLDDWGGNPQSPAFRSLVKALRTLMGEIAPAAAVSAAADGETRPSICVLPFVNVGGDPEQEYFSDGISEDIITDLSKISALAVASRNTAFSYKGKAIGVAQIARQLAVSHVVEGSVRKAGARVRISAQLIEGATDKHIWAERYDRDLTDIFAVQDEITAAIVEALRLRLAPAEKKAITRRSTADPEAYQLYLLARRYFAGQSIRRFDLIMRLCRRAIELDPTYARPWVMIAMCESGASNLRSTGGDDGWAAAERALELDPDLGEAHGVRGRILSIRGRYEEAERENAIALELDPDSPYVQGWAGISALGLGKIAEASAYFAAASAADEEDCSNLGLLLQCQEALGRDEAAAATARELVNRVEKVFGTAPDTGTPLAYGVSALINLGDTDRAKAWAQRAILLDPDDPLMSYNLACSMIRLGETSFALELLEKALAAGGRLINWVRVDTDLDPLRQDPRFLAMLKGAEARLAEVPADAA
ncbi:MAG TPA: TIR domain-containing protein [Caulobacteraceae bacterium]|nr:TIR domain-containing protein [Caulobacteraceae bacterium]